MLIREHKSLLLVISNIAIGFTNELTTILTANLLRICDSSW